MNTLIFPAHLDSLEAIGKFVLDSATEAGLSRKKAYKLRLAVDELATNIINYGYKIHPVDKALLEISAQLDDESLTIVLIDTGLSYDPSEASFDDSVLDKLIEERPIGGLGIFLAMKNVDEFSYKTSENKNMSTFIVKLEQN